MQRQVPSVENDAISLYIRTYYSLLESNSSIRVRSLEEAHIGMGSSLHPTAAAPISDIGAFVYAAVRLPPCASELRHLVLGQSMDQFRRAGHANVANWKRVRTPARRRRWQWNGADTLAVYVVSASDIDDLVPIVVAYQIEWNKLHGALSRNSALVSQLATCKGRLPVELIQEISVAIGAATEDVARLDAAWGELSAHNFATCAKKSLDLSMILLSGSFAAYQRATTKWWSAVNDCLKLPERPVYFVSSNMHALSNLLGGYARDKAASLSEWVARENPEGLAAEHRRLVESGDQSGLDNLYYYLLRLYAKSPQRRSAMVTSDEAHGIRTVNSPEEIEVDAQVIRLSDLRPAKWDSRLQMAGLEKLADSDAVILNIDYPLGMAAYHMLARVLVEIPVVRGVFIMGKAATLNGRVGDVMLSGVFHDEHSLNTFLVRNDLTAAHIEPLLRYGNTLDAQKAITVRSAFLQNRALMEVFYTEGYTVMEMEAGPYLAAITEAVSPRRYPNDELVNLTSPPFPIGIVHYASDTPFSRHKQLLSRSMSHFGMDSTYACAVAIVRRICELELQHLNQK